MNDALDVLDQVGKWKASGKGVAVATVITTWGSSPRPVGSQLGVDETGAMVGSAQVYDLGLSLVVTGPIEGTSDSIEADGSPEISRRSVTAPISRRATGSST